MLSTILGNTKVLLCTLNGAASRNVQKMIKENGVFDVCIIDESSQALEVECWIAMMLARRCIFAGDHLQLPVCITLLFQFSFHESQL